jgi:hypothetical protein
MTPQRTDIFSEIATEREKQEAQWGEQNHPSHAGMIGPGDIVQYDIPPPIDARSICDKRHKLGIGSWLDIALEELSEVYEASYNAANPHQPEATEQQVRKELIQLAAVCVAWIECIDRRSA